MNRNKLKSYAPRARREFIQAITDRAAYYGLTKENITPVIEKGDIAIIGDKPFPICVASKRKKLEERIKNKGFDQVMEAMAYTWFNRFVAIRYMEIHGFLEHGYRVLSTTDNTNDTNNIPDILKHAEHVDLPGLDREKVIELKMEGSKEAELYKMLLIAQCNALNDAMPFLFEKVNDETELLLPDNLLHSDSMIRRLVSEIPEDDWQEVEIIGWLYQFYISEKKDAVFEGLKNNMKITPENIPAATQLFTPHWIVKYLVENSLGRLWMLNRPNSRLIDRMEYYIRPDTSGIRNQGLVKQSEAIMEVKSYQDLIVWQKAMDLVEIVYQATKKFPKEELYGLTNQIRRAAVSIPSNIAEGHARNSTAEFRNFLSIAQGSKAEVETQILIAQRLQYIALKQTQEMLSLLKEISKMLGALRSRLTPVP
ncbi:MAG: four helix bundle protein [Deltaproteobacteria bacterium]|nr:four helix bundle protein [Deltaproteobacteria bacterium]